MMTAVRQTATVQPNGQLQLDVPELAPGTVTEVIVLVPSTAVNQPAARTPTVAEQIATLDQLRAMSTLTEQQVHQWIEDIRLERLAWRIPGDTEP
jgi:hypothetical protein